MAKKITDENGKTYKVKKPIYKKVWFWVLIVIVVGAASTAFGGEDDTSTAEPAQEEKAAETEESKEQEVQESKEVKASEELQKEETKKSKQKKKEKTEASKKKEEAENIDENFEFNDFNFEIYGAKINNESITLYMEYENMGYTDETPPISAVAVDVEQNGENLSSDNDKMKARGEDKTGAYADVKLGTKMPFTETFELENKKDDLEISIVPMMSDEESKKTKIELN